MKVSRRQALAAFASSVLATQVPGRSLPSQVLGGSRLRPGDVETFLRAVRAGDRTRVEEMLTADASLATARDGDGRSAFVHASLAGQREVADLLRRRGIEFDVVESVLARDWERVEALIAADPGLSDAVHPIGGTPLYAGALAGTEELYRLRSLGCTPDAAPAGGSGFTPVRAAMDCRTEVGALCSATDLLSNGADVNAPQRDGDSVLHGAVRRRSLALVRLAIRKGAAVDARDVEGRTALALATELEWEPGVDLLADHASIARDCRWSRFAFTADREPVERADLSDVEQELQNEVTSSSHGNRTRVRELLERDPRLTFSISTDDELAIEASAHVGNQPVMRLHLDHDAPLSLPTATSLGDLDHMRFLLDAEPGTIHERGAHDFPVMWYAAIGTGSVEVAELLRERGASVDQESLGATALHWCVRRDRVDLAKWLIEQGADLEPVAYQATGVGRTPLQLALEQGRDSMAGLLRDAGAKV